MVMVAFHQMDDGADIRSLYGSWPGYLILPPQVTARVAVEQASTFGWERYVGTAGHIIGMRTFGASAPLKELQRKFGFEPDQVIVAAKAQLGMGPKANLYRTKGSWFTRRPC